MINLDYCCDCGIKMPGLHFTIIADECYCNACADKHIRAWVETWGFMLKLEQDFNTRSHSKQHDSRQYG